MSILRMSEAEVQAHQKRVSTYQQRKDIRAVQERIDSTVKKVTPAVAPPKRGMNKWESAFARELEYRKSAGEIVWWAFEPIRIRLANGAWYKPDFVAVDTQGRTEIFEVKGQFREAAKVRLKVAIEKLPYRFHLVRKSGKQLVVTPL